jgi:hypothetical protein
MRAPRPRRGRETLARVRGVRAEKMEGAETVSTRSSLRPQSFLAVFLLLSFRLRRVGRFLLGASPAEEIRHPIDRYAARNVNFVLVVNRITV